MLVNKFEEKIVKSVKTSPRGQQSRASGNDRQNVKNEKVLKEDVVVDEDDELATLADHATVDSVPMTDIDDEIQRSLILDQDLSDDDEDDLSEELVDTSSFVDARDSLMKELGIVDREIISIPS